MSRKPGKGKGNGAASMVGAGTGSNGNGTLLSYDPSHYVVPGQDHKGHSVRMWFRVQPAVFHDIEAIIQSHNWPFKTNGDMVRWAVWEGVKRLEKSAPVPGSMIVVAETIMESCRASEQWMAFKTSIETTERTVRALIDSGNEEEALKLLSSLRSQVMRLEEASWRDQWMHEFNKRFGHIWARAKENPVNLSEAARG